MRFVKKKMAGWQYPKTRIEFNFDKTLGVQAAEKRKIKML